MGPIIGHSFRFTSAPVIFTELAVHLVSVIGVSECPNIGGKSTSWGLTKTIWDMGSAKQQLR